MRRPSLRRGPTAWLACALAGGLQTLSVGWPTDVVIDNVPMIDDPDLAAWAWLLQWLGVLLWAMVLNAQPAGPNGRCAGHAPARRAAALGWLFGTCWLVSSTWWLYISLHRYGDMSAGLSALAVFGLNAALSLYMAIAAYVYVRWRRVDEPLTAQPGDSRWRQWRARWRGVGSNAALLAAVWLLAELARGLIFTGFPWGSSGYAHVAGPLSTLAPWIGVYGIGALSALLAGLALGLAQRDPGRPLQAAARLAGLALAVGLVSVAARQEFTTASGEIAVSLLQGNVAQDQKFEPEHLPKALNWHVKHLLASQADLAIAPETAIPLLPEQLPEGFWAHLTDRALAGHTAVLTGMPLGSFEAGYSNSVVGLSPTAQATGASAAQPYRYDKHHLVPFGEFIPTGFRWFLDILRMPLGDFKRGPVGAPSFVIRARGSGSLERIAPNICYEDLFGEELARSFRTVDEAPTVLANLSNIGWFGPTTAIPQHLRISQLRSLELQRPMVRATNTGATAIIDHQGVLRQSLVPLTQGVLNGAVEGRRGITPYAWWAARFGLWPLILLALAIVAPCIVARTDPRG